MTWPRAGGETAHTDGPAEFGGVDESGWMGETDDPGGAPLASAPEPPPAGRRPAAPAVATSGASDAAAEAAAEHLAGHLSGTSASAFMYFSMAGVFRQADALAFKKFRDRLLAECGGPTDPIEIMMIEELALAHLNAGRLHFKSATADGLEAARVYGSMAILLMGEFRRGALALKSYRERRREPGSESSRSNAGAGAQYDQRTIRDRVDGELGSKPGGQEHDNSTLPLPEPQADRRGSNKQGEKAGPERRRA